MTMIARDLVKGLLEVDADYFGDPMEYAIGAGEKESWKIPEGHPWVHVLRALHFKLKRNTYTPKNKPRKEFWSSERTVKLASGQVVGLTVAGYDQHELLDSVGLSITWDKGAYIFGSRPIRPVELKRVMRDIIRRLERCQVESNWNSYTRGVQEAVNKVLRRYEYWFKKKSA